MQHCAPLHHSRGFTSQKTLRRSRFPQINSVMSLFEAAKADKGGEIKTLLSKGANHAEVNEKGQTALHIAAQCAAIEATKALLGGGADVNAADIDGDTPLHIAADKYK